MITCCYNRLMTDSLNLTRVVFIAGLLFALAVPHADAATVEDSLGECASIKGSFKRLDCYDALAREYGPPTTEGKDLSAGAWKVEQVASGISDATDVYMVVHAVESIAGETEEVRPVLVLRCEDKNTAVIFNFARFIEQSRAEAAIRIDDGVVSGASLKMSASGKAFGYWQGEAAVPFIKRLLTAKRLLVEVKPFGARAVLAEFPVAGLDKAVLPLRQACGW